MADALNSMDEFESKLRNLSNNVANHNSQLRHVFGDTRFQIGLINLEFSSLRRELSYLVSDIVSFQQRLSHSVSGVQQAVQTPPQTKSAPPAPQTSPNVGGVVEHASYGPATVGEKFKSLFSGFNLLGYSILLVVAALHKMDQALTGFAYGQRLKQIGASIGDIFTRLSEGTLIGPVKSAAIRMQASRELGTISTTREGANIRSAVANVVQTGLNVETTTRVAAQMYRMSGYSTSAAKGMVDMTKAMAEANGIGADDLMADLAENAGLLSNAANRLPGVLQQAAIEARNMGVQLQTSENFANRLTGDFETYLDMQAKLQTVMPGVDLTNVMMASQYGSTKDVQDALKSTFGGMDIGRMPRSVRQYITGSTGISEEELVNFGQAGSTSNTAATVAKTVTPEERAREKEGRLWESFRYKVLFGIASMVGSIFALLVSSRLRGGTGGLPISRFGGRGLPGPYSGNPIGYSGGYGGGGGGGGGAAGGFTRFMSTPGVAKNMLAGAAAMIMMAYALKIMGQAVQEFSRGGVTAGGVGLAIGSLTALTVAMWGLSKVPKTDIIAAAAAMLVMSVGIGALGIAMMLWEDIAVGPMLAAVYGLGIAMALLGVGFEVILPGIGVFLLVSAAVLAVSLGVSLAIRSIGGGLKDMGEGLKLIKENKDALTIGFAFKIGAFGTAAWRAKGPIQDLADAMERVAASAGVIKAMGNPFENLGDLAQQVTPHKVGLMDRISNWLTPRAAQAGTPIVPADGLATGGGQVAITGVASTERMAIGGDSVGALIVSVNELVAEFRAGKPIDVKVESILDGRKVGEGVARAMSRIT